eukprot:3906627-Amphidinium_carterae.1
MRNDVVFSPLVPPLSVGGEALGDQEANELPVSEASMSTTEENEGTDSGDDAEGENVEMQTADNEEEGTANSQEGLLPVMLDHPAEELWKLMEQACENFSAGSHLLFGVVNVRGIEVACATFRYAEQLRVILACFSRLCPAARGTALVVSHHYGKESHIDRNADYSFHCSLGDINDGLYVVDENGE